MNHHSPISSSSRFLLAAALGLGLVSCSQGVGGGSTSSSSSACVGEGGIVPSPGVPESVKALRKFSVPERLFKGTGVASASAMLSGDVPLIAIVNEKCMMNKSAAAGQISQKLRGEVAAQRSLSLGRAYPLRLGQAVSMTALKAQVEADPCLIQLSEDAPVYKMAAATDPSYSLQTHLTAIKASEGWDSLYNGLTTDVIIAIIDDGMQMNHPDLSGVLWTNPGEIAGNSIDDDGNGYVDDVNGYNFASSLSSPAAENGASHGTHVAGLAAAQADNGIGISGVMGRHAKIMVLNVFGQSASSSGASIINAINYAAAKGAKVINMSLGGSGTASSVNSAMVNAVAAGSFIAIAAGNNSQLVTSGNFYYPMGYAKDISGAMSVGSVDATSLALSSFSNYSTTYVEIGAPGSNAATGGVYSTYPTNTYTYLQGTSMASPVLAGAAALVIGWIESQGRTATPAEIETLLKSSATQSTSLSNYFMGGFLLNLESLASSAECAY